MSGRVLLVGPVGAGKSSLLGALRGDSKKATKTQAVVYDVHGIDIPGEYLENPGMYRYIIALALEASFVLMLQDGTSNKRHYPPGFASSFNVPVIGVVSKVDLLECDVCRAQDILWQAGVKEPLYFVSSQTGSGVEELKLYLEELRTRKYLIKR